MSTSQDEIVEYCIKNCLFDGWGTVLLENASKTGGQDKNYWKIDFPDGAVDVIDYHLAKEDEKMAQGLDRSNLRTTEKIRAAIKNRLEANAANKKQIQSMLGVYALHPIRGTKATYRTIDTMWRLAGDTATDWNFYSKRLLLAGVYSSTLLYWLNNSGENDAKTWEFLDHRLKEVGNIGKSIADFKSRLRNLKTR